MSVIGKNCTFLFRRVVDHLAALVYPPSCGGCGELIEPGRQWCSTCWTHLAMSMNRDYCPTCVNLIGPHQRIDRRGRCPYCRDRSIPILAVCRLGTYECPLNQAICRFKYEKNIHIGKTLADLLSASLMEREWFDRVEVLCPIPIHRHRKLTRGFNQSQILADRIALHSRRPVISLLRRIRPTLPQVGLSAHRRVENMRGAFSVNSRWPVDGASVCLVDDVMTTGATLFEAARTLRSAGAAAVYAVVLAKADLFNS